MNVTHARALSATAGVASFFFYAKKKKVPRTSMCARVELILSIRN